MHIVLGASGHVGSAVAETLLSRGERVTVVTRRSEDSGRWHRKGAQVAVVDLHDTPALRRVFNQGKRLFLLNPPAAPSTDTVAEERKNVAALLEALRDSGIEKVVAESTYGAQAADHAGDLGVLFEMEEALAAQPIPVTIVRAAYYMSNWDALLPSVKKEGTLSTFYPPAFALPMVAPRDIGEFAAGLMQEGVSRTGLHFFEGPQRYAANDVAAAFSAVLHQPVTAVEVTPDRWRSTLRGMGFSEKAAESFASMTSIIREDHYRKPALPDRGPTTLENYIAALVRTSA